MAATIMGIMIMGTGVTDAIHMTDTIGMRDNLIAVNIVSSTKGTVVNANT